MSEIHSCSYYCTRPACVLAQRDELRGRFLQRGQRVDKWLTNAEPQVDKEQAKPVGWLRDLLINTAATAVAAERQGRYPGAAWVADWLLEEHPQQAEPVAMTGTSVRESQQRDRLDSRLAERKRGPSDQAEFGLPHLAEDVEQAEPVVDKALTNAEPQVNKEQAEPVAIPGAIPMSQVAARSRSMPERAAALEAAREQAKPVPPWYRQFCNCLKCSEALPQAEPVADSGNPSY